MSNLSDRSSDHSQVNAAHLDTSKSLSSPRAYGSGGNGVKGFFLGMLFTVLLGLVGGGAYWFAQRQSSVRQQAVANPSVGSTAVTNPVSPNSAPSLATADASAGTTSGAASGAANAGLETANPAAQSSSTQAGSTGEFKELNLQANHPNGSTLRVTGIAIGDSTITVKLAVTNGYQEAITLQDDNDATILKDDAGNVYNLATPPENPTISINPNSTVKGNFVFIGQLAPSATTLTLTTNSKYGGDATYSKDPKFVIANIPVK